MGKVRFSIICPVYNSQDFLPDCIDSVLNQSIDCWELILINDGSTDDSPNICNYYAEKYKKIHVIHKKNQGQYHARIDGLRASKGKYVIFLDSDDLLSKDCLEQLSRFDNKADLLVFNMKSFSNDGNAIRTFYSIDSYREYADSDVSRFFYYESFIFNLCRCCFNINLFTNDVFSPSEFSKSKIGEDSIFLEKVLKNVKSVYTIPLELYYYRMHSNSATHLISFENAVSRVKVLDYLYRNIEVDVDKDRKVLDRLTWPILTSAFYTALANKYSAFKKNVLSLYNFNIYKNYFYKFESKSRFYRFMAKLLYKQHLIFFYFMTRLNKRKV